jgi:hypothetical protein
MPALWASVARWAYVTTAASTSQTKNAANSRTEYSNYVCTIYMFGLMLPDQPGGCGISIHSTRNTNFAWPLIGDGFIVTNPPEVGLLATKLPTTNWVVNVPGLTTVSFAHRA